MSYTAANAHAQSPILMGLTGPARSGKDSVGRIIVDEHGARRVAFGDTLKEIAEDLDSLVEYTVRTGTGEVEVLQDPVTTLLAAHGGWEGVKDAVPETRAYLVDLGNSLRTRIPGIEIAATFGTAVSGERVVNTNVYHPEEIDAIRAMPGGIVIRVVRPGYEPANPDEARTLRHPVDATIVNSGDLEALKASVATVLVELGIVKFGAAAIAS